MKAIVRDRYGPPEVLELRELDRPAIEDHQVLLRVHASSVNPADYYEATGPYFARVFGTGLRKPKNPAVGTDVAGRVEAVGKDVKDLQPGDEVFGAAPGAWAEYAAARADRITGKPANVSFEETGAVAIAALTALQALRDHTQVQPGQKVLINGASGGVGTYAVQIAKALEAEVTAVCSTRNVDLVQSLGADRVVDYTKEDFTKLGERHDVMLDISGSRSLSEARRVLKPDAVVALVGASSKKGAIGPLPHLVGMKLASIGRSQKVAFFIAKINSEDLAVVGELLEAGKVKSVIDKRYELAQVADALRYLGEGHARGKIVITV